MRKFQVKITESNKVPASTQGLERFASISYQLDAQLSEQ